MKNTEKSPVATREKIKEICSWLTEKKAVDVVGLDVEGLSNMAEGLIVAGANSFRHGQGLSDYVLEKAKEFNYEFLHMEGYQTGMWILLDFNDVIINIFQSEQRGIYRLEDLYPKAETVCGSRL